MPKSRIRLRTVLSAARVASQVDRTRCRDAII
jgi:hypothetical protein